MAIDEGEPMILFALPKGFIRFSLAITAIVAASWWVNFDLTPVATTATSFLSLFLLLTTSRVVLILALCGAGAGIGMGCVTVSVKCFRSPSQIESPRRWVRIAMSCLSVIVTIVMLVFTYAIGLLCIDIAGFLFSCVMFAGLQFSEFLLLRRFLRWRKREEKVFP